MDAKREAIVATGRRLISEAKKEVVLFGSDMSWAPEYRDAIATVVREGKAVNVIYKHSPAPKVAENARILADAGAVLKASRHDTGLRAMLIDPDDGDDCIVYLVKRTVRPDAMEVSEGVRGTSGNYKYTAKIYTRRYDSGLIDSISSVYRMICHDIDGRT